jgi:hypothetical protein
MADLGPRAAFPGSHRGYGSAMAPESYAGIRFGFLRGYRRALVSKRRAERGGHTVVRPPSPPSSSYRPRGRRRA